MLKDHLASLVLNGQDRGGRGGRVLKSCSLCLNYISVNFLIDFLTVLTSSSPFTLIVCWWVDSRKNRWIAFVSKCGKLCSL